MTYTKLEKQPSLRDEELSIDALAPGLYPGEVAVQFNATTFAAIWVHPSWLENGAGIVVFAKARYIKANGETKLSVHDQPICSEYKHSFSYQDIKDFAANDLAKEVALLVLGEPPELMRDVPLEEGGSEQHPVLNVSDEVRFSASIRQAINTAKKVASAPGAASVLGL